VGGHLGGLGYFEGGLQNFSGPLPANNKFFWNPQLNPLPANSKFFWNPQLNPTLVG